MSPPKASPEEECGGHGGSRRCVQLGQMCANLEPQRKRQAEIKIQKRQDVASMGHVGGAPH